jgi:general secretion pathway protein F
LIRQLRQGQSFSAALRQFPAVFPPLYLALVAASEQTGDLAGALARFIEYRGRMDAVRKRLTSASIYPALLLGVGGLVILFLMTYVVPRFSKVYEDLGGQLPLMSRLLMEWGGLIERHGVEMLAVVVVAVVVAVLFFRRRGWGWRALLTGVLGLPFMAPVRERFRAYALARFYRTMGLLLQGGIPVATAMGMSRELLGEDMAASLDRALEEVRSGVALSEALERGRLAPPVASDLLRIGEKAGDMGEKMMRIADFHDDETARWAEWFSKLFEPLLMLVIGLFIAFIVVLLYMPIFELAGSVQ